MKVIKYLRKQKKKSCSRMIFFYLFSFVSVFFFFFFFFWCENIYLSIFLFCFLSFLHSLINLANLLLHAMQHIAQLFKEVIMKLNGCFRYVVFAILNDTNTFKEHNPKGNVVPFEEVLNARDRKEIDSNYLLMITYFSFNHLKGVKWEVTFSWERNKGDILQHL